jgi:hypothetical protein
MARRLVGVRVRVKTVEIEATTLFKVVSSRITPRDITPRFSDLRRCWRRLNQTRLSLLS